MEKWILLAITVIQLIQIIGRWTGKIDTSATNLANSIDRIEKYEAINIGSSFPYSIREIVSIIEEISGKSIKKTWGNPAKEDFDIVFSNIDKAKEIINWKPKYSIYDGLKETINYYREEYDS